MITLTLISPLASTVPRGELSVRVACQASNPLPDQEENLEVYINEKLVEFDNLTGTPTLHVGEHIIDEVRGAQTISIVARSTDQDETDYEVWLVDVEAESTFSDELYREANHLDRLTAYLPEWTEARSNDWSVFRQLMNPLGLEMDKVRARMTRMAKGLSPLTASVAARHELFVSYLEEDERPQSEILSDGSVGHSGLTVYGREGDNLLRLTESSSIYEMLASLPTRFNSSASELSSGQLTPTMPSSELGDMLPLELTGLGVLYLTISDANGLVRIADGEERPFKTSKVFLYGEDPYGNDQEEFVEIVRDGVFRTRLWWGKVASVAFEGASTSSSCNVAIARFAELRSEKQDILYKEAVGRVLRPVYWGANDDDNGTYLIRDVYQDSEIRAAVAEEDVKEESYRVFLKDVSGSDVTLTDFSMAKDTPYIYGVSQTSLYIWDRRREYHDHVRIAQNPKVIEQDFSAQVFEPARLAATPGQVGTVSVQTLPPAATKEAKEWSWKLVLPSGTVKYLNDDYEPVLDNPNWVKKRDVLFGYGIDGYWFETPLETEGDYAMALTVRYVDGTEETVWRLFSVETNTALAQYDLSGLITLGEKLGIDISDSGVLTLWTGQESVTLTPIHDRYILSEDGTSVITMEEYDSIEVDNG